MAQTTNGIQVHSLAVTRTSVIITGNDAFRDWCPQGRMVLSKLTCAGVNPVYIFRPDLDGPRICTTTRGTATNEIAEWKRTFCKDMPLRMFPHHFGATPPVSIALMPVGNSFELHIEMPQAPKLRSLRDRQSLKVTEPELPIPASAWSHAVSGPIGGSMVAGQTLTPGQQRAMGLKEAVRAINDAKGVLGDDLKLTITSDGTLKAAVIQEFE